MHGPANDYFCNFPCKSAFSETNVHLERILTFVRISLTFILEIKHHLL